MYLLILCVLISWPVIIIFLCCFVAITCRWQGGCAQGLVNGMPVTVIMGLKVPDLCIIKPLIIHELYGFIRWHFISTYAR